MLSNLVISYYERRLVRRAIYMHICYIYIIMDRRRTIIITIWTILDTLCELGNKVHNCIESETDEDSIDNHPPARD